MIEYYIYIATFYLVVLTYQDLTNNRRVDDRANWLCMGLALSLISHVPHNLWYMLAGLPILLIFRIALLKFNAVGEADINSFVWILYGFYVINISALITFSAIFIGFYLLKTITMVVLKKKYLPLYPEILGSWIITIICFGLL